MTGSRCNKPSTSARAGLQQALLALGTVSALLGPVHDTAFALSSEPTPLGLPQNTTGTTPPASGGGIEAQPLPPVQPAPQQPAPQQPAPQPGAAPTATPLPPPPEPGAQTVPAPGQPSAPAEIMTQPMPDIPAASAATGLGADIWQASEVSRLMGLVPKLPAPVSVPSLADLQRRLLLTDAPSAGASGPVDPLKPVRADKLHQMGFNDAAISLTQGTPQSGPMDPQEAVEKALLVNDTNGACQMVDQQMARNQVPDLFFRRAVIFCQIMRQQNDPASLGLDLLRERNDPDPATKDFIALASLANGETKRVPKNVAVPDPLNVALMKTVGMPAPNAIGAAPVVPVGTGGSVMIARDATRPLPERVAAAELAHRFGLIPAQELSELYLQMPAGIADPTTAISMGDTVELRAQLYQAAYRAQMPAQKARAIDAALKKAQQRGDYLVQAELYGPLASQIAPSRDMPFFAPQAARLMFVIGQTDKGGYWLNTVAANTRAFSRPGEKEGLDLLGQIAGLPGSGDPVAAWTQASGTANPRVELLYSLLAGLNRPVTSTVAGSFQASPVIPLGSPAAEIVAAAAGKRKGEAITLALVGIGGDKAIAADPIILGSALRSLIDLGLEADARRIAREIAVLAGL
ncbi:hypothetical protein [Dongia sp.]|uniref:hypothetical protein n=1 Tax=Dongia sp. TaxID=1977262 RepID=UPI0035B4163E